MAAVQLFALATTLLLGVLLAAVSRVIEARANGGSARRGLSTGEQRTALRLQVAARTILAIPLGLIGTMTIYAFGAGYLSRFGVFVPPPMNFIVSVLLLAALLVALFFFVVPDPTEESASRP